MGEGHTDAVGGVQGPQSADQNGDREDGERTVRGVGRDSRGPRGSLSDGLDRSQLVESTPTLSPQLPKKHR